MDYKEKYNAALERARQFIEHPLQEDSANIVEYIFPELADSEDERIRKEIIDFLELSHPQFVGKRDHEKWIAWLEKQGKQKPADKVEPKFHEGDWIISNNKNSIYQVIEVKRGIYVIRDNADNHEYHIGIEECEKSGRLFTIQDAKDGDLSYIQELLGYDPIEEFEQICEECLVKGGKA
jgi:hypothetical protein